MKERDVESAVLRKFADFVSLLAELARAVRTFIIADVRIKAWYSDP